MRYLFFVINILAFVYASEDVWSSDDIPGTLRHFFETIETSSGAPILSSSQESLSWPCYFDKNVVAAYVGSSDGKTYREVELTNLDGKGPGKIIIDNGNKIIEANDFTNGQAQGPGKMFIKQNTGNPNDDFFLTGTFQNGCLESRVLGYSYLPLFDDKDVPILSNDTVLFYIATYAKGIPVGPIWRQSFSQDGFTTGYLYTPDTITLKNPKDPLDKFGAGQVFIYPDFKTAMQGEFDQKGRFVSAKQVDIIGTRIRRNFGSILEIKTSSPFGPEFKLDRSTKTMLSSEPMLRDPYEIKMVTVKQSSIPNAGQGVFLNKAAKNNTIVAYFNGVRIPEKEAFSWNPFKKSSVYYIAHTDEDGSEIFIDIPEKFSDWNKYQASTGHKVNHNTSPNAGYSECDHPRFGKILCLYLSQDLPQGSELLVKYDISISKDNLKQAVKVALSIGQLYTGKERKEIVNEVKPYIEMAAKFAEKFDLSSMIGF